MSTTLASAPSHPAPSHRATPPHHASTAWRTRLSGPPQGTRTSGVLFAMCLSLVLVVSSVSMLNLALPDIAVSLGATNTNLTWIADAFTVALAGLVLPFGELGDRFGRRTLLIIGNLVFGAAALAASRVHTPDHLIVLRAVMGVGAALIMPGTLSTITATFPPERRDRGVAVWSGFATAGAILGMLAAGGLLRHWSWRSIFVASAIAALVAAVSALLLAPNTRDEHPGRLDAAGGTLLAIGIGCLVYAIIESNDTSWTAPRVVVTSIVCVVAFLAWAVVDLRTAHPILDPRLFLLRGFTAGTIALIAQFMALFGFFFVGLQYLQLMLGYSPLKAAVALVPVALVVLPVTLATPHLLRRLGMRVAMSAGLLLIAGGMAGLYHLTTASGYRPFLLGLLAAGLGLGLCSATGTVAITGAKGTYLGDPSFDPLMAELDARNAVVFIHPQALPGGTVEGIPAYSADFLLDTTRAALNLARHGVLTRYPNIRFILSHGGGFIPYAAVRLAPSASPAGNVVDGLRLLRRFWFDTALTPSPFSMPSLLRFARRDHILFGSDFPYASARIATGFSGVLGAYPMPRHRGIDRGNAEALFPRLA